MHRKRTQVTDKPTVNFNFDKTLRADAKNEPFRFVLEGRPREMKHVNDLDAIDVTDLASGQSDVNWRILKHAADAETYKALRDARPTVGQLNALILAYNEHCGVGAGE